MKILFQAVRFSISYNIDQLVCSAITNNEAHITIGRFDRFKFIKNTNAQVKSCNGLIVNNRAVSFMIRLTV